MNSRVQLNTASEPMLLIRTGADHTATEQR